MQLHKRCGELTSGCVAPFQNAPDDMQSAFSKNVVYCGGETAQNVLHLLHGHNLPGSVEVVPGIRLGGQTAASEEVNGERLPDSEFKFFSGAVTWAPGDLDLEVLEGCWHTAACSRALMLKQCLQLPVPLWQEVMMLMGGDFLKQAQDVRRIDE